MTTRDRKVTFRLSDDELDRLHTRAHAAGYSTESYLRSLIDGLLPPDSPPSDYRHMMNELRAIGTNLNQIAIKANTLGVIDSMRYREEVRNLRRVLQKIDETVRSVRKL